MSIHTNLYSFRLELDDFLFTVQRQHRLEAGTHLLILLLCLNTHSSLHAQKCPLKQNKKWVKESIRLFLRIFRSVCGVSVHCYAASSGDGCIYIWSFIPACIEVSTKTNKKPTKCQKKCQKKNQKILKAFPFIVRRQRRLVCGVYGRRDASIACVAASVPPPPPPLPLTPLTHGARQSRFYAKGSPTWSVHGGSPPCNG